jgi:uncharacterized protein (DUF1697 family)
MKKFIILLRGVNVGGNKLLPMKELRQYLQTRGFECVETYIQSGNIVLKSDKRPDDDLGILIHSEFGFTPEMVTLSEIEFNTAVSNNPYKEYEGKFVHFYFCTETPKLDSNKLETLAHESERYALVGNVFYLHAPNGIGRSKMVAKMEACLGVSATGRNLNTINKLNWMIENAK